MSSIWIDVNNFTPTQIGNCILWMDGADTTSMNLTGTTLNWIQDKSSNGYYISSLNLNAKPSLSKAFNGKYTALFAENDGNQKVIGTPTNIAATNVQSASGLSYFLVGQFISGYGLVEFEQTGTPNTRIIDIETQAGGNVRVDYNTGGNILASDSLLVPFMGSVVYNSNTTNLAWYYNGNANSNVNVSPVTNLAYSSGYGFFGQNYQTGNYPSYGFIGEYVGYNVALNQTQRQQIEGYLAWKWGLQSKLPASHPYASNPLIQLPPYPTGIIQPRTTSNNAPFNPRSLGGCVAWFDANDDSTFALSGTTINSWTSKGILGLSTTNTSNSATYSNYNGYPSVFFNSNALLKTNSLIVDSAQGTTWITCAVSLANPQVEDAAAVLAAGAPGAERSIRFDPASSATIYTINTGVIRQVTGNNSNGTRGFIDTPNTFTGIVNGTTVTTTNITVTFQSGTSQQLQMGQWNVGYLYGHIFELIVYNKPLTIAQYNQVESYLLYKWGFQSLTSLPAPNTSGIYAFPPIFQFPSVFPARVITNVNFSPKNYTNLVGWYDASDSKYVLTSGSSVTQWLDKSGSNNNTTSANGTPQYRQQTLNKKSGITFNGSSSYFVIPKIISDDWSIFIVLTTTQIGPGSGGQWWAGAGIFDAEVAGTVADFGMSLYGTTLAVGTGNPPTGDTTIFSGVSINTGAAFLCEFTRVSSTGYIENFVNGSSQSSGTGGTGARTAPTRITIGALQTLATYFSGSIFEIVVYSSYLTQIQRQTIEGYLAWKWGTQGSLPANHPYKLYPPPPS